MNFRQSIIIRLIYVLSALVLVAPFLLTTSVAQADSQVPGACTSVKLKVALSAGQAANQTIVGTLCNPLIWGGKQREVDVLLHGATYNSSYWNWPIDTNQYSYVDDTLLAGRATFAFDAIGAGQSSHPLSTDISMDTEAYVLHQVLNWLHSKQTYSKFVVIGHSFGSITAVYEAGLYHDEDALVLTGYSHSLNATDAAAALSDFYPANQDAEFAGDNLDSGYLTSVPGTRSTLFYTRTANSSVVAYDEAHKDVVSGAAFGEGIAQLEAPSAGNVANNVTVPVLEVLGQEDFLFCGTGAPTNCASPSAMRSYDLPYFSHTPSLTVDTIPQTGHDVALHPSDQFSFSDINSWIDAH